MSVLEDVLDVAADEVGVVEGPRANEVKYNDAYYGRLISGANYAWCVVFVWWCMRRVDVGQAVFPKENNVFQMRDWYKARGRWHLGTPRRGDIVVFSFSHTGIVTKVHGRRAVETIEGNTDAAGGRTGGRVMRKYRTRGILGYCRPDYAAAKEDSGMLDHYSSASLGKARQLKADVWNTIGWDNIYAGDTKPGNAGVVRHGPFYDAKVRMVVDGLPEGTPWKAKLVEARKVDGRWQVHDTASQEDYISTPGNDYRTLHSGPDYLSDGDRVWLQIKPSAECRLRDAWAKAFFG